MKYVLAFLLFFSICRADSLNVSAWITGNYETNINRSQGKNFFLNESRMGLSNVMGNTTANFSLATWRDTYDPYIDQGNVAVTYNGLKFILGQQFYNYGYMISKMATYPLLTDHIWTQQPGAYVVYSNGLYSLGGAVMNATLYDSSDYTSVWNVDYMGYGFGRISGKWSEQVAEIDLYYEKAFRNFGFDFEVYNNIEIDGRKDRTGGYYADLFLKHSNKVFNVRLDALTDNYFEETLQKEVAFGYAVYLNDRVWIVGQYSYNDIKKNSLYLQFGYWRNSGFKWN